MNRSLEGVRGAAALLVVLFHMHFSLHELAATRNGYLCVDLFFVLSGFVIARAYSQRLTNARDARTFIVRRLGRLWPTHIAATTFFYVFANGMLGALTMVHVPGMAFYLPSVRELLGIATLTQGLHLFPKDIGVAVSWSAGDEFYVYVLFAAVCLALRGRARVAAFLTLAASGYVVAIWASYVSGSCIHGGCMNMTFDYGWSRCIAGFFLGALFAECRAPLACPIPRQTIAFAAVTVVFVFAHRTPVIAFAAPIVFAVLVASLASDSGPVAHLFQARPMQYLGGLSYSLYLAHSVFLPILTASAYGASSAGAHLAEGALFLAASFALAHLLHRYVEMPWRERFAAWADAHRAASATLGNRGVPQCKSG